MDTIETCAVLEAAVCPDTPIQTLEQRFFQDPDLFALAIVEDDQPVGLVSRCMIPSQTNRIRQDNPPVRAIMDTTPLIVEAGTKVDTVNHLIADQHPDALSQGFIVTKNGRYLGLCCALTLLKATIRMTDRRAYALKRAQIEAETASRSQAMFLANMSHELRTPLNAIIGFTDFIAQQGLGPISPPSYEDYIRDVNESGKHLLSVINAILDMSKIEANAQNLLEEYCDPVELVDSVMRIMRGMAETAEVKLECRLPLDTPNILVDMQLMRQILMNLLSNAIKFSDPGSQIHVDGWQDGEGLHIAVIDQGCGIAEKDLDRVMQPFGQADISLNRAKQGTGLGLPLVKALCEAHQGRFSLQSTLGEGTKAIITLPSERIFTAQLSKLHPLRRAPATTNQAVTRQ